MFTATTRLPSVTPLLNPVPRALSFYPSELSEGFEIKVGALLTIGWRFFDGTLRYPKG